MFLANFFTFISFFFNFSASFFSVGLASFSFCTVEASPWRFGEGRRFNQFWKRLHRDQNLLRIRRIRHGSNRGSRSGLGGCLGLLGNRGSRCVGADIGLGGYYCLSKVLRCFFLAEQSSLSGQWTTRRYQGVRILSWESPILLGSNLLGVTKSCCHLRLLRSRQHIRCNSHGERGCFPM